MWHFLKGYVIIQAEGLCAARFLKRITDAGIRIRNVRRTEDAVIRFTIPAKRFFALRKLRKGLPLRIRIVARGGMPFLLRKLKCRPVLWVGTCLLFCGMLFLSKRIWIIRVSETKQIDTDEVLSLLADHGIRPGTYPEGPILITTANDLSAQVHDAAWIGLDREGILLSVNVVEALPESAKRTNRIPSDIIAECDGVVTSIRVMRGQARVKVGDRVKAGDVLISGTVYYKDETVDTAADGVVYAAVSYRSEAELSDHVSESYETEASEQIRILRFWNAEVTRTKPSFAHYRLIAASTVQGIGLLPFTIESVEAKEIGFRERALSDEESEQYALAEAREQAYAAVPRNASIINTYGTIQNRDGKRIAVVIVTAEQIIGKTEEIPHGG